MSKYLWIIIAVLGLALAYLGIRNNHINEKYEVAMANLKAYDRQLSGMTNMNTAYQMTVNQLEYYQDSILRALDSTRKELKIKDKNLQALHYVSSSFTKPDTVTLKDTIFREPAFALDTLIGDDWYNVRIGLKYPSTIAVKPDFKSEKHIVVFTKKETVNPPKKWWILRIFQKKHTVLNVDVVEKNPYVENETSKYVEILK